jgi:hypothetical protein
LYCTVLYCTVLYCTVLYCIVLYCIVLHCTVLYCTVLYCTVPYCIVLYCTLLYCTVLYCTLLYCIVLHCTVLYWIVLYCTVLYCTILYCSFFFVFLCMYIVLTGYYNTLMTTASSCPSVPKEQLSCHQTEYHDISDEYFSKNCRENSSFITASKEWGGRHFTWRQNYGEFFLEREMFHTEVVEKI